MTGPKDHSISEKVPFWLDPKKRAVIFQLLSIGVVGLIIYYLASNTVVNLQKQSIATGFGFLNKEAAFEIGESLIPYSAANTYTRALIVGALNTIKVAFAGIVVTLVLGTVIGVARLSTNWLVARLSAIYIEVMQDLPVLLQLVFWYAIFYESLPPPSEALCPGAGIYLCKRGVAFTVPEAHPAHLYMLIAFLLGCVAIYFTRRWAKEQAGENRPVFSRVSRFSRRACRASAHRVARGRLPHENGCAETHGVQFRGRSYGQS